MGVNKKHYIFLWYLLKTYILDWKHEYVKPKPPTYRSRDTTHAQPPNWSGPDPLVYSQMSIYDIARILKTTKPTNIKIYHITGTMKMYPMMQYYDITTWILKIIVCHNAAANCLKLCIGKCTSMATVTWHKQEI